MIHIVVEGGVVVTVESDEPDLIGRLVHLIDLDVDSAEPGSALFSIQEKNTSQNATVEYLRIMETPITKIEPVVITPAPEEY